MTEIYPHKSRPKGTDRHGDPLLSLDEKDAPIRALVATLGWYLLRATTVSVAHTHHRAHHPQPGDLVFIPDGFLRRNRTPLDLMHSVGYLVAERHEYLHSDEDWQQWARAEWGAGSPRPAEQIWYVQYGPNPVDVIRWEDADCHAIPHELRAPGWQLHL